MDDRSSFATKLSDFFYNFRAENIGYQFSRLAYSSFNGAAFGRTKLGTSRVKNEQREGADDRAYIIPFVKGERGVSPKSIELAEKVDRLADAFTPRV